MRITSNPGGHDGPGDYSPDGKRLVFGASNHVQGVACLAARTTTTYTINADGSGLTQVNGSLCGSSVPSRGVAPSRCTTARASGAHPLSPPDAPRAVTHAM
jgi:Tol biopolymer transport system component